MNINLYKLQLDSVLARVGEYCISNASTAVLLKTEPEFDIVIVQDLLKDTQSAVDYLIVAKNPIKVFHDIAPIITKCGIGAICNCGELYNILQLLQSYDSLVKSIKSSSVWAGRNNPLASKFSGISDLSVLRNLLSTSIDNNIILDTASNNLKEIRKNISTANYRLQSRLSSFMRGGKYGQYLQDSFVTQRQGRFVLSVKAEYRGSVDGLFHDQSSTGSTVYIEPFEIVQANNDLREFLSQESVECERILGELSSTVGQYCEQLTSIFEVLISLDIIFAKAEYSIATKSILPILNNKGIVDLVDARHPLLAVDICVPISIKVGGEKSILIISGPNTGGKTVALKIVGLCCAMASCGIFVPCNQATVSVFDNIHCLIGDGQSIEQSLSTFSAHISNLALLLKNTTKNSLLLLDELGSGTDPQEGAAIALGVVKYLQTICCSCVITSHYHQLKEYATTQNTVANASMQFDQNTLSPTYRLVMNIPGASFALSIASNLGLPRQIVDMAYQTLSNDTILFEKLLRHMQVEIANIDIQRQEITQKNLQLSQEIDFAIREKQKFENKLNELRNKSQKMGEQLIENAKHKAENIIEQIKQKLQRADEKALFEARTLKNNLDNINFDNYNSEQVLSPLTTFPKKGDRVVIININSIGTVKTIRLDNKIEVTLGNISINCDLNNLANPQDFNTIQKRIKPKPKDKFDLSNVSKSTDNQEIVWKEIMLIGQKVFDAIVLLDEFVEQCQVTGQKHIRIVHGKGSGALGRGIQQHLMRQRYTKQFRYGGYGEGDGGVTMLELK
ncbi:MAG: Smr/MutS family protein [Firmicutes bacterium]|nr:Smr/MutS family protein [Bacillota bacterium]MCL1954077.1 Smr/MutS family protein [Bacillota bacterium]